jgi:hypothetical protein
MRRLAETSENAPLPCQKRRVIPAKAGIQFQAASAAVEEKLDSRLCGNDAVDVDIAAIVSRGVG